MRNIKNKYSSNLAKYRVSCRFYPEFTNPLTGRIGTWRVASCRVVSDKCYYSTIGNTGNTIIIWSTRPYPRGSFIRPHKELNRVLKIV